MNMCDRKNGKLELIWQQDYPHVIFLVMQMNQMFEQKIFDYIWKRNLVRC